MSLLLSLGLGLFVLPLVLGFVAGMSRSRYRQAPLLATGLVLLVYGTLLAVEGIWAASCWNCGDYHDPILSPLGLYDEDDRRTFLKFTAYIFAIPSALALAGIWTGALIAWRQDLSHGR